MAAAAIDVPTFRTLEEAAGAEFVGELVDTFLEEAPAMIGGLQAAMAGGDAEAFRRIAHSLKSNANTFGAQALGLLARELELAGLDRVLAQEADPLANLMAEYGRVAEALAALRHA